MRAILIDPYKREITEIDHSGELDAMYETIGCELVQAIRCSPTDDLWLDEEGFLKAGVPAWRIGEHAEPLGGRALIFGRKGSKQGPTTVSLATAVKAVRWMDLESTGKFHAGGSSTADPDYDFVIRAGGPVLRKRENVDG